MLGSSDRRFSRARCGGIAVALVIALVILQLVIVGMVAAGARDQSLSVHRTESVRTFYAAESGVAMSMRELAVGVDEDGDGTIGSVSNDGSDVSGPVLLGARIGTELIPIDTTTGEVVALGIATEAARSVRATYLRTPAGGGAGGAGLAGEFFARSTSLSSLSGVDWSAPPSATGPVPFVNFTGVADSSNPFWNSGPTTRYGVRLRGRIVIPQDGTWTFRLGSDDGSRLLIDGVQVINYDGLHSYGTRTGTATLSAGEHDIEVLFFENTGNHGLTLAWQGPGVPTMAIVPPSAFVLDEAPSPEFPPIAVSEFVHLWGDNSANAAFIDGFDAAAGPYSGGAALTDRLLVATNSTASQRVQMSGKAQIRGSLQVGPGGNPASVVALWGGSEITEGASARPVAAAVHRIIDPFATLPASEGSRTYTSSMTISSHRTFQDLSVWGNNTVVTITGNVVIRCTGSFNIGDGVQFELASGATLAMFVAGDVNIYKQAQINFNTGDPSRCWLFMSGTDRRLQLTDRAKLVAHVRNPKGTLELWGNSNPGSELYGTYHGKSLTMGDKTRIHADVSLLQGGAGSGGPGGTMSITGWAIAP